MWGRCNVAAIGGSSRDWPGLRAFLGYSRVLSELADGCGCLILDHIVESLHLHVDATRFQHAGTMD
jgi:hypothetical protein